MLRARGQSLRLRGFLILLGGCASGVSLGCGSGGVHPEVPTPSPQQANVSKVFPFPVPMRPMETPECRDSIARVRAGLALEQDVWRSVSCIVDSYTRSGDAERVEVFLQEVRDFEVKTDRWIDVERKDAEAAGLSVPQELGEYVTIYVTNEVRATKPSLQTINTKTLGAGSFRGLCLPWRRKPGVGGHYEATKQTVARLRKKYSVTRKAEDIMADASQDPDFFAWTEMAAHGQTEDRDGFPSETAEAAESKWREWVVKWFTEAGKRCKSNTLGAQRQGIYLLGYAIHAVQDVAAHRGRTNPEHAYNAKFETNPDKVPGVDALAAEMAALALEGALKGRANACVVPLHSITEGVFLWSQKINELGFVWDGTPSALLAYQETAPAFGAKMGEPGARIRWFGGDHGWPAGTSCKDEPKCSSLIARLVDALK
jgi:hypothetical protein